MDDFDANSCDNFGNGSVFGGRAQMGTDSFGNPVSGREKNVPVVMKVVDWVSIHVGMKRLSFLMDCCHPGNIPDAPFVAAALQLVTFIHQFDFSNFFDYFVPRNLL